MIVGCKTQYNSPKVLVSNPILQQKNQTPYVTRMITHVCCMYVSCSKLLPFRSKPLIGKLPRACKHFVCSIAQISSQGKFGIINNKAKGSKASCTESHSEGVALGQGLPSVPVKQNVPKIGHNKSKPPMS